MESEGACQRQVCLGVCKSEYVKYASALRIIHAAVRMRPSPDGIPITDKRCAISYLTGNGGTGGEPKVVPCLVHKLY